MSNMRTSKKRSLDSEVGSLRRRRAASKLELQLQPPLDRSWSAVRKYAGAGSDTIGARIRDCVRSSAVDRASTTIQHLKQRSSSNWDVARDVFLSGAASPCSQF